jgi:FkbM family methyltransferase
LPLWREARLGKRKIAQRACEVQKLVKNRSAWLFSPAMFDHPAWRGAPLRTGLRVASSIVRKRLAPLRLARVPYDGGDTSIYADLGTPLGLELYRYGVHHPDIELTKLLLSPGDVFVDGGANVGLYALAAATKVGPNGKVVAFEPAREVRLLLIQNLALNRLVQVQVIPFALSSAPGEAAFRTFQIAGTGLSHLAPSDDEAGTVESVMLTTLDAVLGPTDRQRLTLLKLDLEGAEHAALRGATEILRDVRPHIIIELDESHLRRMGSSAAEVLALLGDHGYQFFQAHEGGNGEFTLSRLDDPLLLRSNPNIFATAEPTRVEAKGVRIG